MRTSDKLTLVAALTLVLSVPSDGSHARTRYCVAPEIPDYCKRVMCIGDSVALLRKQVRLEHYRRGLLVKPETCAALGEKRILVDE